MEELKEFFKNVKRIADGIESIANYKSELARVAEEACNSLKSEYEQKQQAVPQPVQAPVQQPVQMPVQQPVQQVPVQTAIPISNTVQTYTQEQLAVAMGRAVDSGKQSQILAIISSFGVSSLMELKQEQYNDLALKLKEIGVDV